MVKISAGVSTVIKSSLKESERAFPISPGIWIGIRLIRGHPFQKEIGIHGNENEGWRRTRSGEG